MLEKLLFWESKFIFDNFQRFQNDRTSPVASNNRSFEYLYKNNKLSDNRILILQIIDTCGQERFKAINITYFKKADVCILVYDITNKNSFASCKDYYIERIKELCKSNIRVLILGNKTDLNERREVSEEEGKELAFSNNYLFFETSCLTNINVNEALENLIEIIYKDNIKENIKDNKNKISNKIEKPFTEYSQFKTRRDSFQIFSEKKHFKKEKKNCC